MIEKYNILQFNKAKQSLKKFLEFLNSNGFVNDIYKFCNPIYVRNPKLIEPLTKRLTELNNGQTFYIHSYKIGKVVLYQKNAGVFIFEVTVDGEKRELRVVFEKVAEKRTGKIIYDCGVCPAHVFNLLSNAGN